MRHQKLAAVLVISLIGFSPVVLAADDNNGWFGFSLDVDVEGLFSPTVLSVTVDKVEPASAAATNGIKVGDQFVQVEGTAVAGEKASKLKALMHRSIGESLHLRLKRRSGEIYTVVVVATAKPK